MIEFNINDHVYAKVTPYGWEKLKEQHDELMTKLPPSSRSDFKSVVDKDGWTKFQMHDLMNRFGEYMTVGGRNVIETTIRLETS